MSKIKKLVKKKLLYFGYKIAGNLQEKKFAKKIAALKDGDYRISDKIPYVCQFASPQMVEKFVENDDNLRDDPNWRGSGAESLYDYVFWVPKLCGMACFSMILKATGIQPPPIVELGKRAFKAGCYRENPENPKRLIGLLHYQFLKFAESFGFSGKLLWFIGIHTIASEILKNNFVIASVSNQIRYRGVNHVDKNGHLVVVLGFKIDFGRISGFYINDPAGFYNDTQENYFVRAEDFINCFSGRIIVLKSTK
ncbi:C39 family peptidase [Candidatus Giovannonibacteria bacterium]|nr:C39 family peptidase [Candidatus Giovannonibacteria bacterium]